jgi:hypothetical protein
MVCWIWNVSTWLDQLHFPEFPFLCFSSSGRQQKRFGEILEGERKAAAILYLTGFAADLLAHFIGVKQQVVGNLSTFSWTFPQCLGILTQECVFSFSLSLFRSLSLSFSNCSASLVEL